MTTDDERARLEARARAALCPASEWEAPLKDLGEDYFDHGYEIYPTGDESGPIALASSAERAAYIAAASPAVVLALLAELDAARAERDAAQAQAAGAVLSMEEACEVANDAAASLAAAQQELDAMRRELDSERVEVLRLQERVKYWGGEAGSWQEVAIENEQRAERAEAALTECRAERERMVGRGWRWNGWAWTPRKDGRR